MTTHQALELQPSTLVEWLPPKGHKNGSYPGVATPIDGEQIRIKWDDFAEPDSTIRRNDRRLLASIEICNPKTEMDL